MSTKGRRDFIKTTAGAAAAISALPSTALAAEYVGWDAPVPQGTAGAPLGADEPVRIGVIGTGGMGTAQDVGALAGVALLPHPLDAAPVWQGASRKVGLIGAGRQGRAILAELLKIPGGKVTAICDVAPARLESAVSRTKGAEGFAGRARVSPTRRSTTRSPIS